MLQELVLLVILERLHTLKKKFKNAFQKTSTTIRE